LVDAVACEGCGVCVHICPRRAIDFTDRTCGEWFVSDTRAGPMVHARLGIAAENSGKLVSTVRTAARSLAVENGRGLILVDGPPGIGCPVISSITGATAVLIVTEPSVSGVHDLERVLSLTRHFGIPAAVCVNRWDLDADACRRIERLARSAGAASVGRIRYDPAFTEAQIRGKTVVELDAPAADDIRKIWNRFSTSQWWQPGTARVVHPLSETEFE
jgi:MinD superfamily P-loop ATPase